MMRIQNLSPARAHISAVVQSRVHELRGLFCTQKSRFTTFLSTCNYFLTFYFFFIYFFLTSRAVILSLLVAHMMLQKFWLDDI